MKLLATFAFLLAFFAQNFAQNPNVSAGEIRRFENFNSKFVAPRNVDIWLPPGYDSQKKYAVLYLHDGQMLFDSATTWNKQEWGVDETLAGLMAEKRVKNCIIVGIWNSGNYRHAEYFPQKPFEKLTAGQRQELVATNQNLDKNPLYLEGAKSDNYLKFIVLELKPFIDKTFSTRKNRANTFIAGSSMGGLISMYAICEYPKIFGGAACLSTHWIGVYQENKAVPDVFFQYLKTNLPSPRGHKIYFDHGTVGLDGKYSTSQKAVDKIMLAAGFSEKNWMTKVFEGRDHTEKSWRERLEIPLVFLLK